ncbi:MAG: class I SAM-dependent RNA methyltransferase [Prolixibacteraceae bacterium]|nr:class I SAM-dependent RNA methyltransferase [Prolixibacteraceae bacterium]
MILSGNYNLTAKTLSGLEEVLAKEIENIGGTNIKKGHRAVFFTGDLDTIYKSNYYLRTALRVLKEVAVFQFGGVDQFYLKCKKVNWLNHMKVNQDFIVNSTVKNSKEFRNSMYASLKVKDAIVDRFREVSGKRPDVNTSNPDIIIHAHINHNTCILSVDSSGESLHKRGYRTAQGDAPLSEVLAAGMILLSGYDGSTDFIDPMCGSGTLPIEAALIAKNIAPGKFRKEFAFEKWPDFDKILFEKIKTIYPPKEHIKKIYASDISGRNIAFAQTNARRAGILPYINFQTCNMMNLAIEVNNALLIINPPYGERIADENIDKLYAMTGERLKHQFSGNTAWILTSYEEYAKYIALKPDRKIILFNGAIKCTYTKYTLFKGKMRNNKAPK